MLSGTDCAGNVIFLSTLAPPKRHVAIYVTGGFWDNLVVTETVEVGTEKWHGTRNGYSTYRCRCDRCKAANSAYNKAYYAENKERVLGHKRTYVLRNPGRAKEVREAWEDKNAEKRAAWQQEWQAKTVERRLAVGNAWREANRETVNKWARIRRAESPEAARRACAKWRATNAETYLAKSRFNTALRRARRRKATITPFTYEQLAARMAYWGNRCYMCGGPFEVVDHVKPLTKGGAHALVNFRPACSAHNGSKSNRWFGVEWVKALTGGIPEGQMIPAGPPSSW